MGKPNTLLIFWPTFDSKFFLDWDNNKSCLEFSAYLYTSSQQNQIPFACISL